MKHAAAQHMQVNPVVREKLQEAITAKMGTGMGAPL